MNVRKPACVLLLAASCAACAPLAMPPESSIGTVTVQGVNGPLSPAQGAATVARAVAAAPDPAAATTLIELMENLSPQPLYKDNDVGLLVDGPQTYDAMLAAIRAARRYIHIEMYIVDDDQIGKTFAEALIQKAAEGVAIRLLYDSIGSWEASAAFFDRLRNAGIEVLAFGPANPLAGGNPFKINNRDHRKILVVDGEAAFTGGINIDAKYSTSSLGGDSHKKPERGWRDTDIVVQGPAVEAFESLFQTNWARASGQLPDAPAAQTALEPHGKDLVRVLSADGGDGKVSPIRTAYELAIEMARERVWITQPYFTPDAAFVNTIRAAAKRGVDVRIIVPATSDSTIVLSSSHYHYAGLLKSGVRIYELRGTMVHAKTAVIDGIWSTVGSSNLDSRSFLHNDEVNAVIVGDKFAKELEARFDADLLDCREITRADWSDRSVFSRISEFFTHGLAYWL